MGAIYVVEERCFECGTAVEQPGFCRWCLDRLCVECERVVLAQPNSVCLGCVESYVHSMRRRDKAMNDLEQWDHEQYWTRINGDLTRVDIDCDWDGDSYYVSSVQVLDATCPYCDTAAKWEFHSDGMDRQWIECECNHNQYPLAFGAPPEVMGEK